MRARYGVFFLVVPLVAWGCPSFEKSGAQGSSREISVFTNLPRDSQAFQAMRGIYEFKVNTVREEQFFILDPVSFDQFNVHRLFKNQVFLVDLSQDDDLARKVPGYLGEKGRDLLRRGEAFSLLVRDTWALGQSTVYLIGHTETQLEQLLRQLDPQELRDQLAEAVYEGLVHTVFVMGENEALTRRTAGDYGWYLRLLPEFAMAAHPEGNFVKYDCQDPVRLILVHWVEEPLPLTVETWRPVLDRILRRYNDQDYVMDRLTDSFLTTFQDGQALKWEGVWQNDKYVIGGAFRAYAFHRGNRSYLLIGMVYNPAGSKVPALIQTEAVLRTFTTVE